METYCVKERKKIKCVPGSDQIIKAKYNRLILRCICANCHIGKLSFIASNKKGRLLDIHSVIGKLPRPKAGFTLPSHKYTGPYNPLDQKLDSNDKPLPGQKPFNQVDAIALKHDICYRNHNDKIGKKIAINRFWTPFHRQKPNAFVNHLINILCKQQLGLNINLVLEQKTANGVVEK